MPIALLLLLTLGTGTSFAAQGSLPGDKLYPVKIHVNENMESLLAINSKDAALVHVRQAERRLAEAAELSKEGRLNTENSAEIKSNFQTQAALVKQNVDDLRHKGERTEADKIDGQFEAGLSNHLALLDAPASASASLSVSSDASAADRESVSAPAGQAEGKVKLFSTTKVHTENGTSSKETESQNGTTTERSKPLLEIINAVRLERDSAGHRHRGDLDENDHGTTTSGTVTGTSTIETNTGIRLREKEDNNVKIESGIKLENRRGKVERDDDRELE